ncbi:MAG: DIP1984 family protein [Firmicutes bacterium]|nr:DIP1984 family protein [Dethiobacter sp.]MBS3888446.1 DIP1984 family protein [Bacillota bacterium]MBS4055059.1 DIP1984 family protein [Thermaerobacter sp.]
MKLAEALIMRADQQRRLSSLRERLVRVAKAQEGEKALEDPAELLLEVNRVLLHLTNLMQRINRTNSSILIDEHRTLSDALAERDALGMKRSVLNALVDAAAITHDRFSKSEIKYFATVDVQVLQKEIDGLAQAHRELDTKIQTLNWTTDLAE